MIKNINLNPWSSQQRQPKRWNSRKSSSAIFFVNSVQNFSAGIPQVRYSILANVAGNLSIDLI